MAHESFPGWHRQPSLQSLVVLSSNGESVVFDRATGDTHFLSELPVLVLQQIDEKPVTMAQLLVRLDCPEDLDDLAVAKIRDALATLEKAELVNSGTLPQ